MKVLHCAHGFAPENAGGVESYVARLLAQQRASGHEVLLLCGSHHPWPEPGIERLEVQGCDVRRLHRDDLFFDLYSKHHHPGVERLFDELLAQERPDLIHVHHWIRLTGNLVEVAARHGIPAVVTLHDLYTSCPRCFRVTREGANCDLAMSLEACGTCAPRFGHESEREVQAAIALFHDQFQTELRMAARVVVATEATRDLVGASLQLEPERFDVLPLAYEPRFAGLERSALLEPLDGEPLRFGYWGNLTYRKGAQLLARAFRSVMQDDPPRAAELHLFGQVDTEELDRELRETCADLPVVFHGRYEYEALAACGLHMAVFPMLCFETYGFVLDECFELGLPCIVTDLGAMASRAGAAALRVPPGDEAAMAGALRRVLAESRLLGELREAIRPSSLSAQEHGARLLSLYEGARREGVPAGVEPVEARRRLELLLLQRESAHGRVLPPGGPQ